MIVQYFKTVIDVNYQQSVSKQTNKKKKLVVKKKLNSVLSEQNRPPDQMFGSKVTVGIV